MTSRSPRKTELRAGGFDVPYQARSPEDPLYYEDEGSGSSVVLIHGWTCDSSDWQWQLAELASRYRVVAPDLPGHGHSAPSSVGYHPGDLADAVVHLMEVLDLGPAAIIGHSLGAAVAARIAVEHRGVASALVAIEPAYGVHDPSAPRALVAALRSRPDASVVAAFLESLDSPWTPDEVRSLHRSRSTGIDVSIALESLAALWERDDQISAEPSTTAYLSQLTCHLFELYSEDRPTWDWTGHLQPSWRREVWPGLGHWPHQERPDVFNALLLEWLGLVVHAEA